MAKSSPEPSKRAKPIAIARTIDDLRRQVRAWRQAGAQIGFVPTMGALHEGHLSLVRLAKSEADRVVVSIFVNPKQFAPHEDLARYPRDLDADTGKLAEIGVDLVYAPDDDAMYPPGFTTTLSMGGVARGLESDFRPHFFDGVATVVAKLLVQCSPDIAVFGEKDYQQLLVVRRMVDDLNLPVRIIAGAIVREPDGLALSSRNRYLAPPQRLAAAYLHRHLNTARETIARGSDIAAAVQSCAAALMASGFERVDYVELRDAESLEPVRRLERPARLLAAAWIGATRLIDNLPVTASSR